MRNSLWSGMASVMGAVTGIVASLLIVRSLTVEEYGIFSYYLWLGSTLGVLGALALPPALTKLTSELRGRGDDVEADAVTRWVLLGVLALNALLSIGVLVWALRMPSPQQTYVLIIAAVLIPQNLAGILRSSLWGRQRYSLASISIVVALILQLVLVVTAYLNGWGILGYLFANAFATVVTLLFLLVVVGRTFRAVLRRSTWPEPSSRRSYASLLLPMTLIVVIEAVVWQRSEIFFLQRFSPVEEIGFYNLAFTVFAMCLSFGLALVHSFYPAISHDFGAQDWTKVREKISQSLLVGMIFAIPLCFGGWATFDRVVLLIYGDKMQMAIPVAHVLIIGLLPGVLVGAYSLTLTALVRPWLNVRIGLVMAVINVAANLVLIPRYGALGGAAGSVAAQFLYVYLLARGLRSVTGQPFPWRDLRTLLVIGGVSAYAVPSVLMSVLPGTLGLMVAIGVAVLAYAWFVRRAGYLERLW